MSKVLELKKKLHAFKNGIKYISMTHDIKNETLSNILSLSEDSIDKEQKQFSILKEDDLAKKKV